jgi:septum formation topological specificity factor MinE
VQASAAGDKNAGAEQEVNIEEILNDLRDDIMTVYREYKKNDIDLNAKQTIDILTVSFKIHQLSSYI